MPGAPKLDLPTNSVLLVWRQAGQLCCQQAEGFGTRCDDSRSFLLVWQTPDSAAPAAPAAKTAPSFSFGSGISSSSSKEAAPAFGGFGSSAASNSTSTSTKTPAFSFGASTEAIQQALLDRPSARNRPARTQHPPSRSALLRHRAHRATLPTSRHPPRPSRAHSRLDPRRSSLAMPRTTRRTKTTRTSEKMVQLTQFHAALRVYVLE